MAWMVLITAGICEVGWTLGLKYSEGFTRLWPGVATIVIRATILFLLGIALRSFPIGTAYAVWTGIGATGTAVIGMFLFGESASPSRLLSIALIVLGIAMLKVVSP